MKHSIRLNPKLYTVYQNYKNLNPKPKTLNPKPKPELQERREAFHGRLQALQARAQAPDTRVEVCILLLISPAYICLAYMSLLICPCLYALAYYM